MDPHSSKGYTCTPVIPRKMATTLVVMEHIAVRDLPNFQINHIKPLIIVVSLVRFEPSPILELVLLPL